MTEVVQYCGHEFDTVACAFLPPLPGAAGQVSKVITASKDSSMRVWDQNSGECVCRIQDDTSGSFTSLAVLPADPAVAGTSYDIAATTITGGVFVYRYDDAANKLTCVAKTEPIPVV